MERLKVKSWFAVSSFTTTVMFMGVVSSMSSSSVSDGVMVMVRTSGDSSNSTVKESFPVPVFLRVRSKYTVPSGFPVFLSVALVRSKS